MTSENLSPSTRALFDRLLAQFHQYAQEHSTTSAPDQTPGGDPLTRDAMQHAARVRARAEREPDNPAATAAYDMLLADLASSLTLTDLNTIRRVAAAATDVTPRLILDARDRGTSPDSIAAEVGLTTSRVNQIIRGERQRRTALAAIANEAHTEYEAARAALPPGDTAYTWRIDLLDGPAGPGWHPHEFGEERAAPGAAAAIARLARRFTSSTADDYQARVLVWQGPEGTPDTAHTYETDAQQ
ncbi:hypothetical protein AB0E11_27850 [Streptomyces fradiae]|uniref:hypothetical protein n=1 Tax=Streptomyces fradiae TaxID=1906 RepID=UPI00340B24A9